MHFVMLDASIAPIRVLPDILAGLIGWLTRGYLQIFAAIGTLVREGAPDRGFVDKDQNFAELLRAGFCRGNDEL